MESPASDLPIPYTLGCQEGRLSKVTFDWPISENKETRRVDAPLMCTWPFGVCAPVPRVIHTSRPMWSWVEWACRVVRKPKTAISGHTSSFGFWWGLTPKPLPTSVYLSVKESSAWEKIVVFELAWAQSFLPPLSQLVTGMGLCSPR